MIESTLKFRTDLQVIIAPLRVEGLLKTRSLEVRRMHCYTYVDNCILLFCLLELSTCSEPFMLMYAHCILYQISHYIIIFYPLLIILLGTCSFCLYKTQLPVQSVGLIYMLSRIYNNYYTIIWIYFELIIIIVPGL